MGRLNGFFLLDNDLLEKYNTIWNKVSADIEKKINSKPVYNKNYLKVKIKSYGNKVTDFYDKKILSYTLIILAQQ